MASTMKNSGVEWIGHIPENWEIEQLGKLYKARSEKVSDYDYPPLSVTKMGIVPQLKNAAKSDNHNDRKRVCIDDFVINSRSDRKMSAGTSKLEGSVSLINIVLYSKEVLPEFSNYLLKNYGFAEEFYRWGTGIVSDLWSTNYERMKKIPIPLIPLDEQRKIAVFLDEKISQIEDVIYKTKESIGVLKSYKQALIVETVTKGMASDVKMKDSGIEWIDYIPEHWNVLKLNQLFKQVKEKNENLTEQNLLSLSYGRIIQKNINTNEGLLPESFEGYNIIEKDDIVLRMTDLQNDQTSLRVGLCLERGIITSAYISIRKFNEIDVNYAYYFLHSFDIYKGFYGMGSGVRQGVTFDILKKLNFLYPPIEEQQQIADFLDEKTVHIDSLVANKEKMIQELESYKKSLVYEYVTGKREVL